MLSSEHVSYLDIVTEGLMTQSVKHAAYCLNGRTHPLPPWGSLTLEGAARPQMRVYKSVPALDVVIELRQ